MLVGSAALLDVRLVEDAILQNCRDAVPAAVLRGGEAVVDTRLRDRANLVEMVGRHQTRNHILFDRDTVVVRTASTLVGLGDAAYLVGGDSEDGEVVALRDRQLVRRPQRAVYASLGNRLHEAVLLGRVDDVSIIGLVDTPDGAQVAVAALHGIKVIAIAVLDSLVRQRAHIVIVADSLVDVGRVQVARLRDVARVSGHGTNGHQHAGCRGSGHEDPEFHSSRPSVAADHQKGSSGFSKRDSGLALLKKSRRAARTLQPELSRSASDH